MRRPQFQQMVEDAEISAFDVVLAWKMDRFARNMQNQFFHEKVLNDCGVRLESIKENISENGIEASMSKGMHAILAQIRSQQSAEDTMRGMLGKARNCQYLGYQWFGYSHDRANRGRIREVPEQQEAQRFDRSPALR